MKPSALPRPNGQTVAIVLGAAVWANGRPSPTLLRRAQHAARLFATSQVDAIICCGGLGKHPPSEAEVIAKICLEAGVPKAAVHLETHSTSTRENLMFARPLIENMSPKRIVVVTDIYHAPRAWLLARQSGFRASLRCPPARQIGARQWFRHIPREFLAIAATLLRLR